MVLAIAAPSLADDLNPPDWAGAPGTIYGIWNFNVESPSGDTDDPAENRGDYPEEGKMVPHDTNPDPDEHTYTYDTVGAHKYMIQTEAYDWSWLASYEEREGVIFTEEGLGFYMNNFEGDGTKLIRLQITWWPSEEAEFVDWYVGWNNDTEEMGPLDPSELLVAEEIDLDDGWRHSTYEIEIPDDNPSDEAIWVGTWGNNTAIDQVVIDTICYSGDEPPVGPGRPVTVDTSDMPVYEPADPCGPPQAGSVTGQLFVNLTWQPSAIHDGEPNYIPFTATVVIDPNEGPGLHEDFKFSDSTNPNGTITLTFDEAGWSTPQPVNVEALADLDREGDQRYPIELTVTIDIADPDFGNPTPVIVESSVVVVDNDIPYISVLPVDPCSPLMGTLSENEPCVPVCVNVTLSHLPTDDVYVLVERESYYDILLDSMSVMDPPLDIGDPNRLTFTVSGNPTWIPGTMTSDWDVPQQICLEARDDPCLAGAWLEWVGGEIVFTPYSEDERYRISWLTADGTDPPEDPCGPGLLPSGGEAELTTVDFTVQDNECGAVGYADMDFNEDCRVGLADFVDIIYAQWLYCTDPYEAGCDMAWNLITP